MRADRLVALVLLLRRHGKRSATALAHDLEVSTRTVLRDVEALSAAGVPVYAERGRHGGIALLPGFRTELTGLNHEEAFALLVAGSRRSAQPLESGSALASAMLKLVDALPAGHRDTAAAVAQRLLIEPEADLLARRVVAEDVAPEILTDVRRAVLDGRKLRLRYAADGRTRCDGASWRTVDPIGLVTVRGRGYLLATRDGADRTYRLDRVAAAEVLPEPADRSDEVDLAELWRERSERFRAGDGQITVPVHLHPARRDELVATALAIVSEVREPDGRLLVEATFQDLRHAEWARWQLARPDGIGISSPGWAAGP